MFKGNEQGSKVYKNKTKENNLNQAQLKQKKGLRHLDIHLSHSYKHKRDKSNMLSHF